MSKPDRPGELRGVTVDAISLVPKAANGEKFKIFKSAEAEAPEVVEKDERGLFRILKEFFTGKGVVEKGEVADVLNAKDKRRKFEQAMDALRQVLGFGHYIDGDNVPETDSTKVVAAIDDFRNVVIEILIGKSEVEKAGRKISGDRLSKLKNIQAMLGEVLSGLDDDNAPQEAEELTKEELQSAFSEVIAPLVERIEKVEKARGISNRVPEDSTIEKDSSDFWGGIF